MTIKRISGGTVHKIPIDVKKILISKPEFYEIWEDITPLSRNEFICWIEDTKNVETRQRRINIMLDKFKKGQRRPCCWAGCKHR